MTEDSVPPPGPATPGPQGPPPGGPPPGPRPGPAFTSRYGLVRPHEGRYLAGVCAAIGRATNTDPVLWRVILAVLGFFGGIGILVYVSAWLIIPGEGDTASPVESMLGRGRSSMSPVTVIVLSILVAVSFGFIVTDAFRAVLLGAAILVGGALILNRERERNAANPNRPGYPPVPPPPGGFPAPVGHPAPPTVPGYPPVPPGAGYPDPSRPPGPYPPRVGPGTGTTWDLAQPQPVGAPGAWHPATAPPAPGPPHLASAPAPPAVGPAPGYPRPGGYRPPFAPHGPYAGPPPGPPPPPPPVPRPAKRPRERSPLGAVTFFLIFVALGVVAVLDLLGVSEIRPPAYFAAALATIGLGLLVGTWFGRARWLIALGLVTSFALGIVTVAESWERVRTYEGNVVWAPTSHAELADRYEHFFGTAVLDLREVDFSGQESEVSLMVNVGEATVRLPSAVDVVVVPDLRAGEAVIFGQRFSGVSRDDGHIIEDLGTDGAGGGRLTLRVHLKAGHLEVTR